MENFDDVYTLEFYSQGYWQVGNTYDSLNKAINAFRENALKDTAVAWRVTTPMPKTGD